MANPSEELAKECRRLEESCLYTSTSFFIWLRFLRTTKTFFIVMPLILGSLASFQLLRDSGHTDLVAVCAFLAGLLSTIYAALKIDKDIEDCVLYAAEFKNLQDLFRRAALVSVHKPFQDFETEVSELTARLEKARASSITPPEFIFWLAQRKVKSGDYDFDIDAGRNPNTSLPIKEAESLINEIEKRFEIALTVSIFFPVLLAAYFAVAGGTSQPQDISFFFFLLAGLYLFSYVAFQFVKRANVSKRALKVLNAAVLLGIACYILPVIFLVITANGKTPITWALLADAAFFVISLWGMIIVGGVISLGMLIGFFYWAWSVGSKPDAK